MAHAITLKFVRSRFPTERWELVQGLGWAAGQGFTRQCFEPCTYFTQPIHVDTKKYAYEEVFVWFSTISTGFAGMLKWGLRERDC